MDIAVLPTETATVQEAQDQVTTALRSNRGLRPGQPDNFAVVSQDRMLDTFNKITAAFFVVMIALSSVGLMVGGVGVVAIMMISVTERTREIGVRKALGATRREIMFQFLVEAATLTLVGCLVGMAAGALIAWAIRSFTPIPATVPLLSVVAAVTGVDSHRCAVRTLSGQQGVRTGSGGGAAVRVEALRPSASHVALRYFRPTTTAAQPTISAGTTKPSEAITPATRPTKFRHAVLNASAIGLRPGAEATRGAGS